MSAAGKLLVLGGICLAAFGMLYGLHYALFAEHQSLDRMGSSLATAFIEAAQRRLPTAHGAIDAYASTKYEYVRQVDVHSHWIGLSMLMIVLGVLFKRVSFPEGLRFAVAAMLLAGSIVFPLGVILQTAHHGSALAAELAIAGAGMVIVGLGAVAVGFARPAG